MISDNLFTKQSLENYGASFDLSISIAFLWDTLHYVLGLLVQS